MNSVQCSTSSSSSWFSFSSAFALHSVHLLTDLSQTKTHTEMYPQTQLGTAVCPLTDNLCEMTRNSVQSHADRTKQARINFFYAVDVMSVQNNLICNYTWHNSAKVYVRTKAQDKVITVTLQMQSRAQYPPAVLFSLFHGTILSACVCCLFYKTNKDKQSWNSD